MLLISLRKLISPKGGSFNGESHGLFLQIKSPKLDTGREHRNREDRVCLVCMSSSVEDKHHFLSDCSAYSHIRQQYSHLSHQASSSIAAFLATDQPNVVGRCISRLALHKDNVFWPVRFWLGFHTL